MSDLRITQSGQVRIVEICRGPHNFFDTALIRDVAEAFECADADPDARAILLCAEGRNFCAGANFTERENDATANLDGDHIYRQALRLFRCATPVVAAIQGAATGGGLGLALVADFRVVGPGTRLAANFARLGIHCGFGISVTLPRVVGVQQASRLLFTGERIDGAEAARIGLADMVATEDDLRRSALGLAEDIAGAAPLAVTSMRATLRAGLVEAIAAAVEHEMALQKDQFRTIDFREGVLAMEARRKPVFYGR
jgi:enoyl-CoA hydratase/carnithine racemase